MIIYSSAKNYYLQQGALQFTLNALGDPNKISVAVAANAAIMAYAKVDNTPIIDYDASLNYRTWRLQASPTHFDRSDKVYVYVRLSKTGDDAMVIFPYEKIPIDPALYDSGSSSSSSDEGSADPNYYYIMLGALTASDDGGLTLINRQWAAGEVLSYGELDTARYWEEESSSELDKMFRLDGNNVIWTQHDLTFVTGAKLRLLRMSNFANNGTVDVTRITRAADITTLDFGASDTSIATTAGMAKYLQLFGLALEGKFLRKDQPDSTDYKLTIGEAEVTGDLSVGDDATIGGNVTVSGKTTTKTLEVGTQSTDKSVFHGQLESDNFNAGLAGWKIDRNGSMEVEEIHARSAIVTEELRINRQQAQEGDTIYSENDQIESVEEVVVSGEATYVLTLKEKWEGYFTAQQYGNIIRGKINTLAAKDAGVWPDGVDYTEQQYQASQGVDAGGNKYYTSFMHVIATHNTSPSTLNDNQIQVALYGDNDVPMSRNYPPCPLMAIARWGCRDYADPSDPHYEDTLLTIRRRQSLFMLTTTDGHIIKLVGVNKPILEDWNVGATFGELPDFVKDWSIGARLIEGKDYLYAQGVVVGDFIKVDIEGKPIVQNVDCGEWVDGNGTGTVNIEGVNYPLPIPSSEYDDPDSPYIGHGIYLVEEHNNKSQQYETHDVWRYGCRWRALQHQPVISGGVATFYPPTWNSYYWKRVEGSADFSMKFTRSGGTDFSRGAVNTTIIPQLFIGNEDITDDPSLTWNWERSSDLRTAETIAKDNEWNAAHRNMKQLVLTSADMPTWWNSDNRIRFTVVINVPDGRTIRFDY